MAKVTALGPDHETMGAVGMEGLSSVLESARASRRPMML